ncbi:hypothetical protein FBU30_002402 [Linnemannia zychae]|nr:hypothetical protein FBU30_002402 [Linnemannia zychae]
MDESTTVYSCLLCGQQFQSDSTFRNHKSESHDGPHKRIHPLRCYWCPKLTQTRRGLALHLASCNNIKELRFPSRCPACEVEIGDITDLSAHCRKCLKWQEDIVSQQGDLDEFDSQLVRNTRHVATARLIKDLFDEVEIRLPGGDKMVAYVLPGGGERLGRGQEVFARSLKRRRDEEIVDKDLRVVLMTHAFCSLVEVEKYQLLKDDDPLNYMPFNIHGKEIARRLSGMLIQSGADVLLCLKVEVYGRRKSEDPHGLDRALPDIRPYMVTNEEYDSTRQVIFGTARWNALITLAVIVTTGQIIVGPHNPSFHPHAASHVWVPTYGEKDLFNNIERHTRSKFNRDETFQPFAAVHPRFLHHRTLPVTLSTLWEFKANGRWSGLKVTSFIFNQLYANSKLLKADVESRLEKCRGEKDGSALIEHLQMLVQDMDDVEHKPVSDKVERHLTLLAGKIQGTISDINKGTIANEVETLIKNIIKGKHK